MGAAISTSQWYIYGKRHFTKTGYARHIKNYTDPVQANNLIRVGQQGEDGVNLGGKVVVVTGANSGMGKAVATYAAAKGAKLYMVCRSEGRAKTARDEIAKDTANEDIKIILADVGELSQVRKAAEELQSAETKIDCLVCNAGALVDTRKLSSEGYEITFASHLLGGSYLLSELLLPQLKAADDGRVVFVSSGGMLSEKFPGWKTAIDNDDSAPFDGFKQYAYAKRGQVILAEENAKIHPEIKWVSCHPGWASTPGVDESFGDQQKYLEPLRNAWEGAEGIAWLMATNGKNLESGAFYLDRAPQSKHISGLFMTEGSRTKNSREEVDDMMANLKKAAGLE
jgi:dehydrogenase/reductase SDR family protein 12